MSHDSDADHHAGLARDLELFSARLNRRRLLEWAACLGASALGCSGSAASSGGDAGTASGNLASDGSCSAIPEETAGPYPGDGTNGPNALALSGIVRSDIRSSIAHATGAAGGVPLEVRLRLMDSSCTPLPGFAVYLWHCDRKGRYSMYSSGAENENYLRGVQEADDDGVVTFSSIFPACYTGRGRTSTSRSTRAWRPRAARGTKSKPRSSPCPKRPATRSSTRPATKRA